MGQVDALRMVEHVRSRLVDMAVSENYFRDSCLSDLVRKVWAGPGPDGGLVSELWVEGAFPGELSHDTLESLAREGIFPKDLLGHIGKYAEFPVDRPLYNHQSESIRAAATGGDGRPSLVITAGTGLGKTESFLLPMLSDLWTAPPRINNGGMRCLILYPMNALVADQVDRIYKWLQGQTKLSVFHFTSETPEDARKADRGGVPKWDPCRMRTRQEARGFENRDGGTLSERNLGQVPDIVITNYSMLEYMLCRPQDTRFFGPDLRCIILDEAHLYSGSLAAEITMLLRRVRERCGVKSKDILHLATSATLGGTEDTLRGFASDIFSADDSQTKVIRGRYADHAFECPTDAQGVKPVSTDLANFALDDLATITADGELVSDAEDVVSKLCGTVSHLVAQSTVQRASSEYPGTPARFLYKCLVESPKVRELAEILAKEKGQVISLNDLAQALFNGCNGESERKTVVTLLRLSASARMSATELPLVPHRVHLLVRAPEGLSVCLNPDCTGPDDRRVPSIGSLQPHGDEKCRYCRHVLLPVHRCNNCGEWALAAHENREHSRLESGFRADSPSLRTFYLLAKQTNLDLDEIIVDTKTGETLGFGSQGTRLWKAQASEADSKFQVCPTCASPWKSADETNDQDEWKQPCRGLFGGRRFALSVVAETVLHDLPSFPDVTRNWKPAHGRRLLCFSDSRASAARLGPVLTQQHEMQVVRAAMARCVSELVGTGSTEYLESEVKRLSGLLSGELSQGHKYELEQELSEKQKKLSNARIGTPFPQFAAIVANRTEIEQLMDRNQAEKHQSFNYGQADWNRNLTAIKSHAEALVAKELQRPLKRQVTLESVGLLEIVYPGTESLELPPVFEEKLPSLARMTVSESWPAILALLLDTVRADGCVSWTSETTGRIWLEESPLSDRWLTRNRGGWRARAFVGVTSNHNRRAFVSRVLISAGCDRSDADRLSEIALESAFDQLYGVANGNGNRFSWLRCVQTHQTDLAQTDKAIQILFDGLVVRRPKALYRCNSTGTIWAHSAMGHAPLDGCLGNLQELSTSDLDNDPRWGRARRELMSEPILSMGLWGEEHSAQLSPIENRRLQDLFKSGIRNVLSATTTMELGIDIGGLNGVLLSNAPPGPANHRQRAGRAGRRSDGSAVVVTFAGESEYDRHVFLRFGDFLRRKLKEPTVFLDRTRVIRRHLHAVLLSEFLRLRQGKHTGAMHAFGQMGRFCGIDNVPARWASVGAPKPVWNSEGVDTAAQFFIALENLKSVQDIRSRIASLVIGTKLDMSTEEDWREFVEYAKQSFARAVDDWKDNMNQLRNAWNEIPTQPNSNLGREMAKANSLRYMIKTLCEITVIEWLADHQFLPRYGFPVNLQSLSIRNASESGRRDTSAVDERYRLQRSSLLALREYVPGSKVLVGGRVAMSRGLRKHWTDSNLDQALGLQYFALECPNEHVFISQSQDTQCPTCDSMPCNKELLVFPRFGYTTAGWEKMKLGTNLDRVGEQSVCPIAFTESGSVGDEITSHFAGVQNLTVRYKEGAALLVRNAGERGLGFAICTKCGFAMSEDANGNGRMGLPPEFTKHPSIFSSDFKSFCWGRDADGAPVLRNRVLAAKELTDMMLLEWPGASVVSPKGAYTLGRALIMAGSRLLELDERELGLEIIPLRGASLGIVIFDTSPGGAGHCKELLELGREWIDVTHELMYIDEDHDRQCEKACLDCILDFSGQYKANQLDRRAAFQLLNALHTI
ncbi:MAG: hypothetical protein AMXMBFR84_20550 [Candidatus Hydrogenedentota bacterium]